MQAVKGTIYPVRGPVLERGVMLVDDGRIKAIGQDLDVPAGAEVLDFSGQVILPGLIDAHSHVGIWGDGEGPTAYDGNEKQPINAKVRALDAVNPRQRAFASAREGGITTIQVLPGSGTPVGGLALTCKTAGDLIDDMVLRQPSGLKLALGENPKHRRGNDTPQTRMGTVSIIRDLFERARQYAERKQAGKDPALDLDLEAACQVLEGEIPLRIHAHRADDIAAAVRLAQELGASYSIEHGSEGHQMAGWLADQDAVVHVGPGLSSRTKVELRNFTDRNPAILAGAGVTICLMTDHPFLDSRYLLVYAAVSHKHGLSLQDTLEALTINPARSLGVEERVGSLEPGKDADFIVLSGQPFSMRSVVQATFIEGKQVYERPVL